MSLESFGASCAEKREKEKNPNNEKNWAMFADLDDAADEIKEIGRLRREAEISRGAKRLSQVVIGYVESRKKAARKKREGASE